MDGLHALKFSRRLNGEKGCADNASRRRVNRLRTNKEWSSCWYSSTLHRCSPPPPPLLLLSGRAARATEREGEREREGRGGEGGDGGYAHGCIRARSRALAGNVLMIEKRD
jgi:hypothetical protein